MIRKLLTASAFVLLAGCATTDTTVSQQVSSDDHSMHSDGSSQGMAPDRLNSSPRHSEWVEVKRGDKTIRTWVVYPQTSEKTPVVLVIHENKGLNDWARGMADQIAEAGYIAVAPDLLSEFSATEKSTNDFATPDAATAAIGKLNPVDVQADLQAVADWAKTIPAANGKLASAGFCWGGSQSFTMATKSDDLNLAMVFYGSGPTDATSYENVKAPVVGFYGGADARINATIPASDAAMQAANKSYDYTVYDGAGHAFMRLGEDPKGEAANVSARNAAWEKMKEELAKL